MSKRKMHHREDHNHDMEEMLHKWNLGGFLLVKNWGEFLTGLIEVVPCWNKDAKPLFGED